MTTQRAGEIERWERIALALVVLVGLVVRAAWLAEARGLPFFELPQTDDFVYARGAERIVSGDVWLSGETLRFGPPYFYLLALVRAVLGPSTLAPRIVHLVLGGAVIPLVWWACRRLTEARWAIGGALVAALYGPAIFFEALLLPETAMTLVHAALAVALLVAVGGERRAWAVTGALAGLAIALRPNTLLLIPALVWLARPREEGGRAASLRLSIGLAIGLTPLALRNLVALGTPWGASTAGINAFLGNGPGATGGWRVPAEVPEAASPLGQFTGFRDAAARALGHPVDDAAADRYWLARTLDHVLGHPLDAGAVLLRKAHLFWNARELSNVVDYDFTCGLSTTLSAPLVQFGWIAPLALAGTVLLSRRERTREERAIAALAWTAFAAVVLVFVQDRYRVVFVPWLVVAAVWAAREVVRRAREKKAGPIALTAVAIFAAYPALPVRAHTEQRWAQLGLGYEQLHRDAEACAAFTRALALAPDLPVAREGRARACGD
ncbi:MAG: glycosyltransferase family 39 protein [Sandaracinus sp.]